MRNFKFITAYADDFSCCAVNFERDKAKTPIEARNLQTHEKARLV
ncbi:MULTISPECIES: hypothetical protein [unclassified Campylobacter]|nr:MULTISPECIES: hypothetical protein [unclassified Campylobacter]MDA3079032.1 hypothetical protein [Campylobacter sp. CS_NA2]MDA3080677.1 hypothetical protein [Campylobacter sp. CS_NA1]MDA3085118.1 hypothetical protein [Campylobacter sp. CS_ED1]MDA3089895.1 hypothetical protein [Campylobacter sp. CS_ED2]WBR51548.1 hypothetical protein PF026_01520 [Campylobacter sp. CS_NA3]